MKMIGEIGHAIYHNKSDESLHFIKDMNITYINIWLTNFPLLFVGVYLTCTMAITTLAMVATVFVLNLYGMKEKPVPLWAKKVFTIYVARFLCICDCGASAAASHTTEPTQSASVQQDNKHNRHRFKIVDHSATHSSIEMDDETMPLRGRGEVWREKNPPAGDLESAPYPRHPNPNLIGPLSSHDQKRGPFENKKPEESKPDYAKDWVHVAAVFDRLFFWLCLVFILITTLILFHPLTTAKYFSVTPSKKPEAR